MDKTSTLRAINYFTGKVRKTNRKTYHELESNTVKMSITLKLNLRSNIQTHT